jgi:CTP synthase (UTP-ammonia lyase)
MEILGDFQTTVKKALSEIDENYMDYEGLVICGTHSPNKEEAEKMIDKIRKAHLSGTPFLGICFGHQLAAIEHARTICNIPDATSEEWGEGTFVVVKRKEGLKVGLHEGETYWNNYEVIWKDWSKPYNFITSQFHPEYQSSKKNPHFLLVKFLNLCRGK